jgi:hypothetical protein
VAASGPELIIVVVGILVCAYSGWGIFAPQRLVRTVSAVMAKDWGIHAAVAVRLLLGSALIIAAPGSRFPLIFQILGWIAIAAAVVLALMGRDRLSRFVSWFERISPLMTRVWLLFGLAFGGFLIYGVS